MLSITLSTSQLEITFFCYYFFSGRSSCLDLTCHLKNFYIGYWHFFLKQKIVHLWPFFYSYSWVNFISSNSFYSLNFWSKFKEVTIFSHWYHYKKRFTPFSFHFFKYHHASVEVQQFCQTDVRCFKEKFKSS